MPQQQPLRLRIEALQIGPADALLSFSARLARENGWSADFAARVVGEYKRFLYLVCVSGSEVTPSDEIDQAWHLHLTYTRSYWHDLCREILGFELHHNPTRGGGGEQKRFWRQYEDTLELYRREFGAAPPADIWPTPARRFAAADEFVRFNRSDVWILPRPAWLFDRALPILLLPLTLVACSESLAGRDIWFWIKAAFGLYLVYIVLRWLRRLGGKRNSGSGCGSGCSGCGGCGG